MGNQIIVFDDRKSLTKEQKDLEDNILPGDEGVASITQPTELGESLRELNSDTIDKDSRLSDIDMRSRLHHTEISSILALDSLVAFGICPLKVLVFTRIKKRLAVSQDGKGREEIVQIVGGKQEREMRSGMGGFTDRVKGFFGGGSK